MSTSPVCTAMLFTGISDDRQIRVKLYSRSSVISCMIMNRIAESGLREC